VCTDELEAVAEVEAPDANTLVSGPGRYDNHICWHVEARHRQTVTVQVQEELAQDKQTNHPRYCQQTILTTQTSVKETDTHTSV